MEICDVVVRELVVSSTLVVAGVVTMVVLVVISVVVNSESSEYFAIRVSGSFLRGKKGEGSDGACMVSSSRQSFKIKFRQIMSLL